MESSVKSISRPVIERLPVEQLDEFACRQLDRVCQPTNSYIIISVESPHLFGCADQLERYRRPSSVDLDGMQVDDQPRQYHEQQLSCEPYTHDSVGPTALISE